MFNSLKKIHFKIMRKIITTASKNYPKKPLDFATVYTQNSTISAIYSLINFLKKISHFKSGIWANIWFSMKNYIFISII